MNARKLYFFFKMARQLMGGPGIGRHHFADITGLLDDVKGVGIPEALGASMMIDLENFFS